MRAVEGAGAFRIGRPLVRYNVAIQVGLQAWGDFFAVRPQFRNPLIYLPISLDRQQQREQERDRQQAFIGVIEQLCRYPHR